MNRIAHPTIILTFFFLVIACMHHVRNTHLLDVAVALPPPAGPPARPPSPARPARWFVGWLGGLYCKALARPRCRHAWCALGRTSDRSLHLGWFARVLYVSVVFPSDGTSWSSLLDTRFSHLTSISLHVSFVTSHQLYHTLTRLHFAA